MDHVPGIGPHRVGMVTPGVGSPHNPTQFGFDSTLDAVSRHCEKELRCPIQSCLDAIKHIYTWTHSCPTRAARSKVSERTGSNKTTESATSFQSFSFGARRRRLQKHYHHWLQPCRNEWFKHGQIWLFCWIDSHCPNLSERSPPWWLNWQLYDCPSAERWIAAFRQIICEVEDSDVVRCTTTNKPWLRLLGNSNSTGNSGKHSKVRGWAWNLRFAIGNTSTNGGILHTVESPLCCG